jgi:hypothetical protein
MRNKKPLTIIAVVLGVLVLYCLMNHREGFAMDPYSQINSRRAAQMAAQNERIAAHQGRSTIDPVSQNNARMAAQIAAYQGRSKIDPVSQNNARMAAHMALNNVGPAARRGL